MTGKSTLADSMTGRLTLPYIIFSETNILFPFFIPFFSLILLQKTKSKLLEYYFER